MLLNPTYNLGYRVQCSKLPTVHQQSPQLLFRLFAGIPGCCGRMPEPRSVITQFNSSPLDKMDAISQTIFSNAFYWMKILEFWLKLHWSLFLRIQLTIFQHWFRWWLGADQGTSRHMNQWWLVHSYQICDNHDNGINGYIFRVTRPFVQGIHRPPVNSPHKGQWRGASMFSLICARTNRCANNRDAGDLRRHRVHYDVTVMKF